jgi:hypothetical protein
MRFAHALALRMGRTVRELLDGMDMPEFMRWVAYHELDPFGEERGDLRAALVASVVANVHSTGRTFKPSDFMPRFGQRRRRRRQSPTQIRDAALRITAMLGGTVRAAEG